MSEEPANKESQQASPSTIHIYATETTQTEEHHVTKGGSGYSSPLEKPVKHLYYTWEGWLHPSEHERKNPKSRDGYTGSFNTSEKLEDLAKNFADNYRPRQNPDLIARKESSYTLSFTPTEEQIAKGKEGRGDQNPVIRGLTPAEQAKFLETFQRANVEFAITGK